MGIPEDLAMMQLEEMMNEREIDLDAYFASNRATEGEKLLWYGLTDAQKVETATIAMEYMSRNIPVNDSNITTVTPKSWKDTQKTTLRWLLEKIIPLALKEQKEKTAKNMKTNMEQWSNNMRTQTTPVFQPGTGLGMGGAPQFRNRQIRFPWNNSIDRKDLTTDTIAMNIEQDTLELSEDGIMHAHAIATANMVQDYKGKKVLKDVDELKKACAYARSLPVTDQHPPEGIVMNQDEIMGWTSPLGYNEELNAVECDIEVFDRKLIKKIKDGKTDVSIGFFCDLDETPGKFNDEEYDAIQRNIILNHLAAGLDKGHGRCPDGVCGLKLNDCQHFVNEQDCEFCGPSKIDITPYEDLECVGNSHYDWLTMDMKEDAKLSAEQRKELPESAFCGPGESFPVPDCAHYTAALRMLSRYQGPGSRTKIRACIIGKGRRLGCPGAEEMDVNDWDPTKDAAILKRAITNMPKKSKSTAVNGGKFRLMPGKPDTHDHFVTLDESGNGTSTENEGHRHQVQAMVVKLANGHDHQLVPAQEETPMSDEKPKETGNDGKPVEEPETAPKPTQDTPNEPKPEAKGSEKDEAATPAEPPAENDEASKLVESMKKKLVDSIMDFTPPKDRSHYDGKSLDELKEIHELLSSQKDSVIPSGSSGSGKRAIDDAYAELERKLQK